jgi:DNA-binding MarR family transcriptional regulator
MSDLDDTERPVLDRLIRSLQPFQAELSLPQMLALLRIATEPGLSVNELADRLNCPQQTASRYVAALMGRYQTPSDDSGNARSKLDPLVTQAINQSDPRSRALFISSQGRVALKKLVSTLVAGGKR